MATTANPAGLARSGRKKLGRPPGNYTQYRRLSQLREILENHPKGLSILALAARLHITERSVRRYLRELERDVDIERAPEPDGLGGMVVKIPTRDLPRRVKLHRTQIYGLLMARRVFRMLDGTVFERVLREGVDQLLSHVQRAPRRGATVDPDTRLEDRFIYLPATPMRPLVETPEVAESVDTILDACAQLRVCRVAYRKHAPPTPGPEPAARDSTEVLNIHPYAVVLYKDTIYCVAFVKERGAVRTLRLDRIVDADADPLAHFDLPDDFSVDKHFAGAFGVHKGGAPIPVVIDFHPKVAAFVQSRSFPGESGGAATFEPLPEGWVRLRMAVGDTTEVRSWVLSFGDKARVVEPAGLVQEVLAELRGALGAYEPATAPPPTLHRAARAAGKRRRS